MTRVDSILTETKKAYYSVFLTEIALTNPFATLDTDQPFWAVPDFVQYLSRRLLNTHIDQTAAKFKEQDDFAALSNSLAVFGYGMFGTSRCTLSFAPDMTFATLPMASKRSENKDLDLPVHLYLVLLRALADNTKVISRLEIRTPRT